MNHLLKTHTFLFVGYGINDPLDVDRIQKLNASVFQSSGRTHYALMKAPVSSAERDRWFREFCVQTIDYADHDQLPAILRSLRATAP
jgi:hypothetical protein